MSHIPNLLDELITLINEGADWDVVLECITLLREAVMRANETHICEKA